MRHERSSGQEPRLEHTAVIHLRSARFCINLHLDALLFWSRLNAEGWVEAWRLAHAHGAGAGATRHASLLMIRKHADRVSR